MDPRICHGKPCFTGTRIMVSTILELLESGKSLREIQKGYPSLTPQRLQAALHFAHQVLEQGTYVSFHSTPHFVAH